MRKRISKDRVLKVLHNSANKSKNKIHVKTKSKHKKSAHQTDKKNSASDHTKHHGAHHDHDSKSAHHGQTHHIQHDISHKKHDAHHNTVQHKHYSKKFCPKCGNPITGEGTFCKDCKTIDFDFKDIKILLCHNCSSYNHKNKWQKFHDIDDAVKVAISESVKHHVTCHPLDDSTREDLLSYKAGVHKAFNVNISIGKEMYELPAIVDVTLCPKCSKQGTKYFEGVLQIRNSTPEIQQFIKNDLVRNKSKGIHVNKITDLDKTGINIDYYYTDKGYLKIIADKLRKNFGATIKHNAQLFSIDWETSKNLYRLNVLVEFPHYHKNNVLKIGKQLFKIMSMDEKIHVTNLETGTKTLLPHKESYDVLKPVEVMLIKRYPEFEILDPNTYYQARLMNPDDKLQINQKIRVVVDGGEAWML